MGSSGKTSTAKRQTARSNFLFAKTLRNLIYLSSFGVCYLDVSSNFAKEWEKLKNCFPFAVNFILNLSNNK